MFFPIHGRERLYYETKLNSFHAADISTGTRPAMDVVCRDQLCDVCATFRPHGDARPVLAVLAVLLADKDPDYLALAAALPWF